MLFSLANWREVILNNLFLPITDGPLSYIPPVCIVHVVDVHPRIVVEVSHCEFIELLSEGLVVFTLRNTETM